MSINENPTPETLEEIRRVSEALHAVIGARHFIIMWETKHDTIAFDTTTETIGEFLHVIDQTRAELLKIWGKEAGEMN